MNRFSQVEVSADAPAMPDRWGSNFFIETHLRSFRDLLYDDKSRGDRFTKLEGRCGVFLSHILGQEREAETLYPAYKESIGALHTYAQSFIIYIQEVRALPLISTPTIRKMTANFLVEYVKTPTSRTTFHDTESSITDALVLLILALGKLFKARQTSSVTSRMRTPEGAWPGDRDFPTAISLDDTPGIEYLEAAEYTIRHSFQDSSLSYCHARLLIGLYYCEAGCIKNGWHNIRQASLLISDRVTTLQNETPSETSNCDSITFWCCACMEVELRRGMPSVVPVILTVSNKPEMDLRGLKADGFSERCIYNFATWTALHRGLKVESRPSNTSRLSSQTRVKLAETFLETDRRDIVAAISLSSAGNHQILKLPMIRSVEKAQEAFHDLADILFWDCGYLGAASVQGLTHTLFVHLMILIAAHRHESLRRIVRLDNLKEIIARGRDVFKEGPEHLRGMAHVFGGLLHIL